MDITRERWRKQKSTHFNRFYYPLSQHYFYNFGKFTFSQISLLALLQLQLVPDLLPLHHGEHRERGPDAVDVPLLLQLEDVPVHHDEVRLHALRQMADLVLLPHGVGPVHSVELHGLLQRHGLQGGKLNVVIADKNVRFEGVYCM